MFNNQRIESSGFTLPEIAVIACASAILMLLSKCLIAVFGGKGLWTPLLDWPTLRDALGVAIGILVFGAIVSRWLRTYWFVQLLVMMAVAVGLGQLLALLVEVTVRRLLSAI